MYFLSYLYVCTCAVCVHLCCACVCALSAHFPILSNFLFTIPCSIPVVSMATKDLFFIDGNEILKVDMDRNEARLLYEDNDHPQVIS